jgi:hypothetical protein
MLCYTMKCKRETVEEADFATAKCDEAPGDNTKKSFFDVKTI